MFQSADRGFSSYCGKVVEKLVECIAAFDVVEQSLERHTSAPKDWRAAKHVGIAHNAMIIGSHMQRLHTVYSGGFNDATNKTHVHHHTPMAQHRYLMPTKFLHNSTHELLRVAEEHESLI